MPARRTRRRRRIGGLFWGLSAVALALAFGAGLYLGRSLPGRQVPGGPPAAPSPRQPSAATPAPPEPTPAPPPPERARALAAAPPGARVALVIDDLGRSVADIDSLADLGVPLSYSVLPYETHTSQVVSELSRRSLEILCHLPMEARNGANPGPGALTRSMELVELAVATASALDRVPGAVGVNNHMGSGLTAEPAAMRAMLNVLAERGLFFLDSRTSEDTLGYRLALDLGLPAAERQVFLDGDPDPAAIREQFRRMLDIARVRGAAVAIGHPRATTIEVLRAEVPQARSLGYEFVPVSYLMDRSHPLPQ